MANAMLSVPSVTMNGGSLIRVTSRPLMRPNAVVAPMPQPIAMGTGTPCPTASVVMTIPPSAMTAPQERSTPAVRMMSVCPTAITPTTITCWSTIDRLSPVRNRSLRAPKNAHASTSATSGPSVAGDGRRRFMRGVLLATEAEGESRRHVLALDPSHRLRRDQRDAGIGVAARLLPGLDERHGGRDAHLRHLQWILLSGRGDLAAADVAHALASAVHRDEDDVLLAPPRLECLVGAGGGGLVDRVDDVDVRILLEAVLHRRLPTRLVAIAVGHAHHFGGLAEGVDAAVRCSQTESLEEAVVPLRAEGVSWS